MVELGVDPEIILKNHNINLASLTGSALISQEVEFEIIKEAVRQIDDPLFGLKVGSQSTFTSYGTFALLVMSAPTFREAVLVSVQFQQLSLLFARLTLHFEHDYLELRYTLPNTAPEILPFIADRDFAGSLNFLKELMELTESMSITVGIARPKPQHALLRAYGNLPNINIQFDQAYSWFRLPNRFLSEKLKHGNALAHQLYRAQAQEVLRKFYPSNEDFVSQVKQTLEGYERQFPSAAELAKMFDISERSLRRKLDQSNLSYRKLLDQHRKEKAFNLLSGETISVNQLAENLGYTEASSFLRAFKRWTGMTPKKYLKELIC